MTAFLIIMNYNAGSVEYTDVPKGISSEEAESIIIDHGYNLDEVHYMIADKLEITQLEKL
jgi:hypothetical protein